MPTKAGYGLCPHCDLVIAVYQGKDGKPHLYRHAAMMGAFHRWPACDGSNRVARSAKRLETMDEWEMADA